MRKLFIVIVALLVAAPILLNHKVAANEVATFNYEVVSGDTIGSIANKYKMGSDEIIAVNPTIDPDSIRVGQIIKIPDLSAIKSLQAEVVRLTNIERQKVGVAPLASDWKLARVARYKANDMRDNNYFSHYSPTYGDPFVMMRDFNISFENAGENIAAQQVTPEAVVEAWMNSDTHRTTMLSPKYTRIGAGYSNGGILNHYWVQMFAN